MSRSLGLLLLASFSIAGLRSVHPFSAGLFRFCENSGGSGDFLASVAINDWGVLGWPLFPPFCNAGQRLAGPFTLGVFRPYVFLGGRGSHRYGRLGNRL